MREITLDLLTSNIDLIESCVINSAKKSYDLLELISSEEISNHVVCAGIEGFLQLTSKPARQDNALALVEVYFNGNHLLENLTVKDLGVSDTGEGIGLSLDWNGQEIFYCTERYYGFFSLHSSA